MSVPDSPRESFAALFESQAQPQARKRYHTGENVEVTIVLVAREAVFADLGGKQEGMFELADLADENGVAQVKVGQRVMAQVSGVDRETGQVRLKPVAIKSEDGDEAVAIATTKSSAPLIMEGARVKGAVTGIERYGLFVQIAGTKDRAGRGLVPAQETGAPRNSDLKKLFAVGQELEVKILAVAPDGKIRMSIIALKADDEKADLTAYQKAEEKKRETENKPVRGFGTLGDLMKGVKAAPAKAPEKAPGASKGGVPPRNAPKGRSAR
ncbi:MAG: S1 RNA-binding domain-containing protein [Polyangiaceae bacterium]|nr:S1 RNA-binding domain-containing protein [Polyangiaceae bacterium]